ncbi:MAG: NADH-quinone oxidoreductase subunit M [Anaerolineae bacterium]|nr:NADH-quinone oxidoreductase subunit M [Anaerolineae bacterium]MCZ7552780.1 NADH-quinone oxidoreductase subunit M [Anaerolineales bacterium]
MQFPILSFIVFTPIVAGLLILLIPEDRKAEVRVAALAAGLLALLLSLWAYFSYDIAVGGYQFVEKYTWLPALGISYHVGLDGMNAPLILLTGIVMFTGVLISWGIDDRPREFFAFLFILATGVFGVFVALDLFMLFFFYEIAVFPMYLLISIWGWKVTREYAAMKLTLYLFIGSVVALVGALMMYFVSGLGTFDMIALEQAGFSPQFQRIVFPFVFFGFAVLGGIFPFHNWSPDGHVAAPTAVSMFHAGVLMKLGAFAALRVGIMLLPEGAKTHMWWIIGLTLVNVVYGAFIASVQSDFKYVIGFSSVSHMGLVAMGFATLNKQGMLGAGVQMFSHGVMTALFFAVVGMVYDQTHTREIPNLGGFRKVMPLVAGAFVVGGLVSMGMPGFSGFVAEFPIFMGLWKSYPWIAIAAAISIVITASYIIRIIGNVFFGKLPDEFEGHVRDVNVLDKVALVFLSLVLVIVGVFPSIMVPLVESGVSNILRLLGGA